MVAKLEKNSIDIGMRDLWICDILCEKQRCSVKYTITAFHSLIKRPLLQKVSWYKLQVIIGTWYCSRCLDFSASPHPFH
jgi:predicted HAD superfamily hydrolase